MSPNYNLRCQPLQPTPTRAFGSKGLQGGPCSYLASSGVHQGRGVPHVTVNRCTAGPRWCAPLRKLPTDGIVAAHLVSFQPDLMTSCA